jgi:hypothetical protein
VDGVSLIQSNFGSPGNLELVANAGGNLFLFFSDGRGWNGPYHFGRGARGSPSIVQSRYGSRGNFELVVPSASGGLDFYWRDNDAAGLPWSGPHRLGHHLGHTDGVSLIQSNFGHPGNLELSATAGGRIFTFWRGPYGWNGPHLLGSGVRGNPSLIQSRFGFRGNFEVVVPSLHGGLDFYWRNNDAPGFPWYGPYRIVHSVGDAGASGLIQSNYGGNLEVVSRSAERLDFATRGPAGWGHPMVLADRMDRQPPRPDPALRKAYVEHLGPLVTAPGKGGVNDLGKASNGTAGMKGTDLGTSLEFGGKLMLAFGDTWVPDDTTGLDDDTLAWTEATDVDRFEIPRLQFAAGADGTFAPLRVPLPGVHHNAMNVPVGGITANGRGYLFFSSGWDWNRHAHSQSVLGHLAATTFSTGTLAADHIVPSERFHNVSAMEQDGYVYLYGSGHYRRSQVFLARARPQDVPYRDRWTYFRGTRGGLPVFGPWESSAEPIVEDPCVGELSVAKHAATGLYLLTYNCDRPPFPYHLRTSTTPWGIWSRAETMQDTSTADGGLGVTLHSAVRNYQAATDSWQVPDDGLSEPDHFDPSSEQGGAAPGLGTGGGPYGPYMIPRWFTSSGDTHSIVYTHSSWNPFKVHLMRAVLVPPGVVAKRPNYGEGIERPALLNGDFALGTLGWQQRGAPFTVVVAKGRTYVSSNNPLAGGEAARGALYQEFTIDSTVKEISFRVHGGHATPREFTNRDVASVRLIHRGQIVRESSGLNRTDRDLNVVWNIEQFRGETVRLEIADDSTASPWGFINATDFALR